MALAYQGGKKRLGREIHEVIETFLTRFPASVGAPYFEPFLGMGGVMVHFALEGNRECFASDIMLMWQALQNGTWTPPKRCSKKRYLEYESRAFDSVAFDAWAQEMSQRGNTVFISEMRMLPYATLVASWSNGEKLFLV